MIHPTPLIPCLLAAALCLGCEAPKASPPDPGPVKQCERPTQQCIYAPGKLGVCTPKPGDPAMLECLSQH